MDFILFFPILWYQNFGEFFQKASQINQIYNRKEKNS